MIPVRLATRIVVPDSKNGDVKSTAASLSALTLRDVSTMGILCPEISRYVFGSVLCVFMIPRCAPGPKNITFGNDSVICDN